MRQLAHLPGRAVILLTGEDRVGFLQGLVSNDVAAATPGRAVWAALLTPQGKWLADFFIHSDGGRLLLDCERLQAPELARRLARFRLRARIGIEVPDTLTVAAAWNGPVDGDLPGVWAPDPRLAAAGWRGVLEGTFEATADEESYDVHRLALGLPDGSRDLEAEKTVLLEAGFDELHGVSWTKGCYMGQELTARTKYRGLIKRRLMPVRIEGPVPAAGTPVMAGEREVGVMRSARGETGLAVLRNDAVPPLVCGGTVLHPWYPDWMASGVGAVVETATAAAVETAATAVEAGVVET